MKVSSIIGSGAHVKVEHANVCCKQPVGRQTERKGEKAVKGKGETEGKTGSLMDSRTRGTRCDECSERKEGKRRGEVSRNNNGRQKMQSRQRSKCEKISQRGLDIIR